MHLTYAQIPLGSAESMDKKLFAKYNRTGKRRLSEGGFGHLGSKGGYLEDALDGEHGGEDQVEVGEHVGELQRRPLELQTNIC